MLLQGESINACTALVLVPRVPSLLLTCYPGVVAIPGYGKHYYSAWRYFIRVQRNQVKPVEAVKGKGKKRKR